MAVELIIENGTNVANANSWNTVEDTAQLLQGTGLETAWSTVEAGDAQKLLIIGACNYITMAFRHYGNVLFDNQTTAWPRTKNYDERGVLITPGTIPMCIRRAQAIMSGIYAADPDAQTEIYEGHSTVKAFSTDGLSVQFGDPLAKTAQEGAATEQMLGQRYPAVELLLRPVAVRKDPTFLDTDRISVVK